MADDDPYAAAKANLRDNVKTLFMIFGGIAGVVMAGTPFSGYGMLTPLTVQWWIATGSLLLTVTLIGIALYILLRVLQSDMFYMDMLHDKFVPLSSSKSDRRELEELRSHFRLHKHLLLPDDVNTFEDLQARADAAWKAYMDSRLQFDNDMFQVYHEALERISYWAAFEFMRSRTNTGANKALFIGVVTLASTVVFALSIGAPKPSLGAQVDTASSPKTFEMTTAMNGVVMNVNLLSLDFNARVPLNTKPIIVSSALELLDYQSVNRVLILGLIPFSDKSTISKVQVRPAKLDRHAPVKNKKTSSPKEQVETYSPAVISYKVIYGSSGQIIFLPLILKP